MPDPVAWYVDRSESRVAEFRELYVIEAGDRDILRDAQATLAELAEGADGHAVVDAADGGG